MNRLSLLCFILSMTLGGCFKTPIASQGSVKSLAKGQSTALATEVSATKSIASVDFQSKEAVTMAVADTSKLSGTSISIAPGSLSISTSIIIEQGADLADTSLSQEVALTGNTLITLAGNGVIIRPSTAVVLSKPITLNLPLPTGAGLHLAALHYAVFYKYLDPTTNQLLTGFKVVDGGDVRLVYNEAAKQDIVQMEGYFGAYWVVQLNQDIAKVDVPPAKVSLEPITNKANTQVFSTTGVVAEAEVAIIQAKPEYVWVKPTLTMLSNSRTGVLAASPSTASELKSCKADLTESTTDLSAVKTIDIVKELSVTIPIEKITAFRLFGRFRCLDLDSRSTVSPWTEVLAIDAYQLTAVVSVKSSAPAGVYPVGSVIPIAVNFNGPVNLTGSPVLALETGVVDHNAVYKSGSGTATLNFEYVVQAADETAALNYSSVGSFSLVGGSLVDNLGVMVGLTLPELSSANSLAAANSILIDSVAPVAPSSVGFAGVYSSSTNFPVSWAASTDLNFAFHNVKLCTASDCATACTSVQTSLTSPKTMTGLSGSTYYACVQGVDLAKLASAWISSISTITVDTSLPIVSNVTSPHANGAFKMGEGINFTVLFSEPVMVSNGADIGLLLETGTIDRRAGYISGSGTNTLTFNYNVQAGDTSADLDFQSTAALTLGATGAIKDLAGNNATLTLPPVGGTSSIAGQKAIVIDTTAPVAPVITTPANGAYLMTAVTTISGTAETGTTVSLIDSGTPIGTTVAVSGAWSMTLGAALSEGSHSLTASAVDLAGNTSSVSATNIVMVDTIPPVTPTITTAGMTTNNNQPMIQGNSEPNTPILLFAGVLQVASTNSDASGHWIVTSSARPDGSFTFTAKASDAGARLSPASTGITIVIDTVAPVITNVFDLPSNAPVTMTASVSESATYNWTVVSGGSVAIASPTAISTLLTPAASGIYVMRFSAVDPAGNVAFQNFTLTYDNIAPMTPVITDVARTDTEATAWLFWKPVTDNMSKSGNITYQICKGTTSSACAGAFTSIAAVGPGKYEYQVTGLTPATVYYFAVRAVDELGNLSAVSPYLTNALASGTTSQVAAGYTHSCAVVAGSVRCWGANDYGQLGDGTTISRAYEVPLAGPATKVVTGADFSCSLNSGTVYCWGRNNLGQLGMTAGVNVLTPTVNSLTGVTSIEAGMNHACAILTGGAVRCWGSNSNGQLGNGTQVDSGTPVTPNGALTGVTQLALGMNHTCALSGTTVFCWGASALGQVGVTSAAVTSPITVSGAAGASAIDAGADFTCALISSALSCWGANGLGQLGTSSRTDTVTPTAITTFTGVTSFTLGGAHGCALTSGGNYCWGSNKYGQLGDGSFNPPALPVMVSQLTGLSPLIAGDNYTCGLASGIAKCWGDNRRGQLGSGAADRKPMPVQINGVGAITNNNVAMGFNHSCAIASGNVFCWGMNEAGQLGNNSTVSSATPVTNGITTATAVVAGDSFSCALLSDGSVKCWGLGANGRLGNGGTSNISIPTLASGLSGGVTKISAAGGNVCVLKSGVGNLLCWGANASGAVGDGTTTDKLIPTAPSGTSALTFIDVANGPYHSCGVTSANNSLCWGSNQYSQLGDGTTTGRLIPTAGGPAGTVASVAVGASSTCVILATDGSIRCWGANAAGQLGNNSITLSASPQQALGLSGMTFISMRNSSVCALNSAGVSYCWGQNDAGQIGGDPADHLTPTEVPGLLRVTGLAVGAGRTCHIHDSGKLSCLGEGWGGGFGTATPLILTPSIKVSVVQ